MKLNEAIDITENMLTALYVSLKGLPSFYKDDDELKALRMVLDAAKAYLEEEEIFEEEVRDTEQSYYPKYCPECGKKLT